MNMETSEKKHIVLARKYRPKMLAELIGQDVFVKTISNAITTNKLHHAFLLTGTRGVGKTSSARILALSLNCKKFELSKKYHLLKEDEYFYICLIENEDDQKLYYLMYLKENKKIIECIFNDDNLNNKKITEKYLSEKDAEFKCFRIIE